MDSRKLSSGGRFTFEVLSSVVLTKSRHLGGGIKGVWVRTRYKFRRERRRQKRKELFSRCDFSISGTSGREALRCHCQVHKYMTTTRSECMAQVPTCWCKGRRCQSINRLSHQGWAYLEASKDSEDDLAVVPSDLPLKTSPGSDCSTSSISNPLSVDMDSSCDSSFHC